jgi:hypothetical protein
LITLKKIGIQSGVNNYWTTKQVHNPEIHLDVSKAINIYDDFAQKQGMKQDKKTKDWYMNI